MPENNEDEIIANAFLKIREGVLSSNWKLIAEAYKDISGEELELPEEKPKSRLEAIREKMNQSTPTKKPAGRKNAKKPEEKLQTQEMEGINVVTQKHQGGTKFAQSGFEVISIAPNEDERKENRKRAINKTKIPRPAKDTQSKKYDAENPDREIGYRDRPSVPAPWR